MNVGKAVIKKESSAQKHLRERLFYARHPRGEWIEKKSRQRPHYKGKDRSKKFLSKGGSNTLLEKRRGNRHQASPPTPWGDLKNKQKKGAKGIPTSTEVGEGWVG